MRPLTETRPKPMISFAGHPILERLLDALRESGFKEILLVVGYRKESIRSFFGTGESLGVRISYVEQARPQGTGDALLSAREYVQSEPFLVTYGDLSIQARAVKTLLEKSQFGRLPSVAVSRFPEWKNMGVVTVEDGFVKQIIEKPKEEIPGGLANIGVYVANSSVLNAIIQSDLSERGENELTSSLQALIDRGDRILPVEFGVDEWTHLSAPWDLFDANGRILSTMKPMMEGHLEKGVHLQGQCIIESRVKILSGSFVEGPVFIGASSLIGPNSYVRGQTSIGRNVRIGHGCEVKNSIVMDNVKIPHQSYVGDSIIGEGCSLGAGTITANLRFDEAEIWFDIDGRREKTNRRKLGAVLGDNVKTGVNVSLMPGTKIGSNSWVGPHQAVSGTVVSGSKLISTSEIRPP